jgi:hypothetical protein
VRPVHMHAVIYTSYFINRCIPPEHITEGLIPRSVKDEPKGKPTDEYCL